MITSYRCATCEHETDTNEEMEKHFDDAHSIHCKICDYTTRNPMSFERHMEFAHNKLPKYTCKLCKEKFVGNDDFDKHLEFTHGTNHWTLNLGIKEARRMVEKMRDEDYKVDILIKTQFDGPVDYAIIQNPEINESLNGNQPLGTDRENQYIIFSTSPLLDSGAITYKGNTTVTVMGETEPSDTRYFELILTP